MIHDVIEAETRGPRASSDARAGRPWVPIASGPRRDACLDWVEEIAAALRPEALDLGRDLSQASVGTGYAGIALFFLYRQLAWNRAEDRDAAISYLSAAVEIASREPASPSLVSGLPGIAWALEHARQCWGEDGPDPLEDADEAVAIMARAISARAGEIDLLYGLAGLAVYASERLPRAHSRQTLESVVRGLAAQAVHRGDGIAWERDEPGEADAPAARVINLGLAHGLPASIAVLSAALRAGVAAEAALPLLEGAVRFLLDQRRPEPDSLFLYPALVASASGRRTGASRPTWCYGDLGVACALHGAGTLAGRTEWIAAAREAGRLAARRTEEDSGVDGVTFCHGAAGTAHLFARLFHATGQPAVGRAAVSWCDRLLSRRRRGEGLAGVLSDPPPNGYENWRNDPGLLIGASGVGLALLALSTSVEPQWDRLLLVSPPRFPLDTRPAARTPLSNGKEVTAHSRVSESLDGGIETENEEES